MVLSDSDDDNDELWTTTVFSSSRVTAAKRKDHRHDAMLDDLIATGQERCLKTARLEEKGAYGDLENTLPPQQLLPSDDLVQKERLRKLKGLTGLYTDHALPDAILKARITSIRTAGGVRYGERHVLHFHRTDDPRWRDLASPETALAALASLLQETLPSQESPVSDDSIRRLTHPLQLLEGRASDPQDPHVLMDILEVGPLVKLLEEYDGPVTGLGELGTWLFGSSLMLPPTSRLSRACHRALIQLLHRGLIPDSCWFKSWSALLECLHLWIHDTAAERHGSDERPDKSPCFHNLIGLYHLLSLWSEGLAHDRALALEEPTATSVVVALLHISVDPRTMECHDAIQTILAAVANRLEQANPKAFIIWTRTAAQALFHSVSTLGQAPEVDYDDDDGYLLCALMAEMVPTAAGHLKTAILDQALALCLELPNEDWHTYVMDALPDSENKRKLEKKVGEHHWFCLISCYASMRALSNEAHETLQANRAQQHAVVRLALETFDLSLFFWRHATKSSRAGGEYGRSTDAALAASIFSDLEIEVDAVMGVTKKALQDPNARAAFALCKTFGDYLGRAAEWAAQQAGIQRKNKVQTSVRKYFVQSP